MLSNKLNQISFTKIYVTTTYLHTVPSQTIFTLLFINFIITNKTKTQTVLFKKLSKIWLKPKPHIRITLKHSMSTEHFTTLNNNLPYNIQMNQLTIISSINYNLINKQTNLSLNCFSLHLNYNNWTYYVNYYYRYLYFMHTFHLQTIHYLINSTKSVTLLNDITTSKKTLFTINIKQL